MIMVYQPMTMADLAGHLLPETELERAFAALGERLARRGVIADLFVVGGAAMALAYDANRVTRDVGAAFVPHRVVLEEARKVAEALGLPPWWLNEQASSYVSTRNDDGKREVFDHPGIRVMAASAEHWTSASASSPPSHCPPDPRPCWKTSSMSADRALVTHGQ